VRTLIAVPTYFEAESIVELLERVRRAVPDADVVVVDDGSTDGTRELVNETAARLGQINLMCRDSKSGLGAAYRAAFQPAIDDGYELLVEIDADLSHDPAALPEMLSAARAGADVVIGSRYVPGGRIDGWSRSRTRLSRWGNRYASIVLGLAINDATAGFRVYRASLVRRFGLAGIRSSGYGFQVEMTYRAVRYGARIVEIPIVFRERASGESKMSRAIVMEAFGLVTLWGLRDLITRRRAERMYE
jgi:dolichol-phosphate mannosyltransferase